MDGAAMTSIQTSQRRTAAVFSPCRTYRYELSRIWDAATRPLCFIMLNPSTADETRNDPTVERCERRARGMKYGGLLVVNIFALRSTDPRALRGHPDPVGPGNDAAIYSAAERAGRVICAWGTHGRLGGRDWCVMTLLRDMGVIPYRLGAATKDGSPRHPLYVGYDVRPVAFRWEVSG